MAVEFTTPQPESHVSMETALCNDFFFKISDGNMRKNTAVVAVVRNFEFIEAIFKMIKDLILATMHSNVSRYMVAILLMQNIL